MSPTTNAAAPRSREPIYGATSGVGTSSEQATASKPSRDSRYPRVSIQYTVRSRQVVLWAARALVVGGTITQAVAWLWILAGGGR